MKTKLFTRNLYLGILMVLVLAFSVQGIADALTFGNTRTGDLKTVFPGDEFSITFSVDTDSPKDIYDTSTPKKQTAEDGTTFINSSGYEVEYFTIDGVSKSFRKGTFNNTDVHLDSSGYVVDNSTGKRKKYDADNNEDENGTAKKGTPNAPQLDSLQHHYNDEAIAIVSTIPLKRNNTTLTHLTTRPGRLTGVAGTSGNIAYSLADETKNRDLPNDKTLSQSITLKGQAPSSIGKLVIEIVDVTHLADFPANEQPSVQARQTFTIYVVPTNSNSAPTLSFSSPRTSDYETGNDYADSQIDNKFGTGDSAFDATQRNNTVLTYKVEGSGRLYAKETYPFVSNYETPKDSVGSKKSELTTSAHAQVWLDMNGSSNKVTAYVRDTNAVEKSKTIHFIFKYAQIEIIGGNNKTGVPNARLIDPLHIRVKDDKGRALSGLAVTFTPTNGATLQPVIGTDVYLEGDNTWANQFGEIVKTKAATATVPPITDPGAIAENGPAIVPTDSRGEAQVYLKLGAEGNKTVGVSAGDDTDTFYVTSSTSTAIPSLEIFSGNKQKSANDGKVADPLVVRVLASSSSPLPQELVTFTTTKGYLTTPAAYRRDDPATTNGPATQVTAVTDVNGKAAVTYDLVNHSGASDVIAEISEISNAPYQRGVTFEINPTGSTTTPPATQQPTTTQPTTTTFTVDPQSISGGVGSAQTLTITTPSGSTAQVGNIVFGQFLNAGGSALPNTGSGTFQSTLTLPSTAGTYNLVVNVGSDRRTVPVTVSTTTTTTQTGTLRISNLPLSGAIGSQQVVTVTATGTDGNPAAGVAVSLSVTNGGGVFSPASVTTGTDGTATSTLTRGTTAGTNYFVRASATGYDDAGGTRIVITSATPTTGSTPTPTTPTPTTPTAGTPNLILIDGEATRTGTVNEELDAPLVVEVLDSKGSRVSNARVTFRVRTGQGRLSQRGNGRAIADVTDSRGNASAAYTPMSARSTVEASVGGVKETVTFTITTDGSAPAATPGTGDTPRTTTINPVVKVKAANRPPMLWVDDGGIYALVGEEVQEFGSGVENALNIAVGGNKIYWTEKTGESAGTINSANLDGSGIKELKSIMAVPMGIAVDTTGSKLYWTNSRGRIQSANLNGSGIQNVLQNLSTPMDIALANGNAYWTEATGTVKFVNLTGQKNVRNISTGTDPAGSLAIAGGKVYWTEMTGESAGTVNSANLDGTGTKQLASIRAVPMGIAVDGSRSKLYWTNSRGRVQSANLNGSKIQNVVDGLGMPGDMVLSNSLKAPAEPTKDTTKSTTTAANKYDINGDGSVDSTDTGLIVLAISTGDTAKKYDVNGDGTVNFSDYILVSENIDAGAAGAPSVFGMKMTAEQIERLQEQIDLLIASGDRSPAAMRALIYFQQLIATARPEKTQLLANYPNPFNPETWIPYELATDTEVRITIYNAQGVVIRTLQLGQQSAGYYTDRERAAYWDGRNSQGEQVASGVYFYQLETDEMSALRKMVILK